MQLGAVIADYRWVNRIGVRELAKQIGVSAATLNRVENGKPCDGATIIKIQAWLYAPADKALRRPR